MHTHSTGTVRRLYQCYKGCNVDLVRSLVVVTFLNIFSYARTISRPNVNRAENKTKTLAGGNSRFYAFYVCKLRIVLIKTEQCQLKSLKTCAVIEVVLYTLPYECYVRKM